MLNKPRALDLCGGEGGVARGYVDAGFEVHGIDLVHPDPAKRAKLAPGMRDRYLASGAASFTVADAIEVLRDLEFIRSFHMIHASWPCQKWNPLTALPTTKDADEHPDLITPGRELMNATGLPWVIENGVYAPLDKKRSIVLCGGMFGLRTYRHRRFESSPDLTLVAPAHPKHVIRTATKRRRELWAQGWHVSVTGDVGTYVGPEAMGIDWMTGNGLSQAIPPAYTRLIGEQILAHLGAAQVAA